MPTKTALDGQEHSSNRLLRAFSAAAFARLKPQLRAQDAPVGHLNLRSWTSPERLFFPETGVSSVVMELSNGHSVEVGLVGNDGLIGAWSLFGGATAPFTSVVQIGGSLISVPRTYFETLVRTDPAVADLMSRYQQAFMLQVSETACCNAAFSTHQRLARWLLMCWDRCRNEDLPLTQELLSVMLAANRPWVSVAMKKLEDAKAVQCSRGNIRLIDRVRLEKIAGEAYGVAATAFRVLIPEV